MPDKSEPKFKVGDCVKMKHGGGPEMVVAGIPTYLEAFPELGSPSVECRWFINNRLQKEKFPEELLELVPEK